MEESLVRRIPCVGLLGASGARPRLDSPAPHDSSLVGRLKKLDKFQKQIEQKRLLWAHSPVEAPGWQMKPRFLLILLSLRKPLSVLGQACFRIRNRPSYQSFVILSSEAWLSKPPKWLSIYHFVCSTCCPWPMQTWHFPSWEEWGHQALFNHTLQFHWSLWVPE